MLKNRFRNCFNNNSQYANQEILRQYYKLKDDFKNLMSNNGKAINFAIEMFTPSGENLKKIKTNKEMINNLQMQLKKENISTNLTDYDYGRCLAMFLILLSSIGLCWLVIFIFWAFSRLFLNIPLWITFALSAVSFLYFDLTASTSIWKDNFQIFMSFLPFNNKYSFCKILRKLQRLEKKYEDIEKIYNEYLNHKKNDEKEADFVDGIYDEVIKTREEEIIKDKSFSPVFSNYVKKETSKGKALVRSLSRNNK